MLILMGQKRRVGRLVTVLVLLVSVSLAPSCAQFNEVTKNEDVLVEEKYRNLGSAAPKYGIGYKVKGKDLVAWAYKDLTCRKEKFAVVNRQVHVTRTETSRGFLFGSSSSSKIGWGAVLMGMGAIFVAAAFLGSSDEDGTKTQEELDQTRDIMLYSGAGVGGLGVPFLLWGIIDKARAGTSVQDEGTIEVSKGVEESRCGREYAPDERVSFYLADGNVTSRRTNSRGLVRFDLVDNPEALELMDENLGELRIPGKSVRKRVQLSADDMETLKFAAQQFRQGQKPPRLEAGVAFSDASGNSDNTLDAEEKAALILRIKNKGSGIAYGVEVKTSCLSSCEQISYQESLTIGRIEPLETKIVEIPLKATLKLPSGEATFRLEVPEKFRFDALPVKVKLTLSEVRPPVLTLAGRAIRDGKGGLAEGDGDSVIEPNESIELTTLVQNKGTGDARDVVAVLSSNDPNILLTKRRIEVGQLDAGKYKKLRFSFQVSARYDGANDLPIHLELREARSQFSRTQALGLRKGETTISTVTIKGDFREPVKMEKVPTLGVDVDQGPRVSVAPDKNKFAVIIGIEKYREGDVPTVPYAARDARLVRDYLIKGAGFPEENIHTLVDSRAAKTDIQRIVEEWLPKNVNSDSTVFFYFSGHGAVDSKSGIPHLVPYEAHPSYLATQGYPVDRLLASLSKLPAKSSIVALDSCYVGLLPPGERPIVMIKKRPHEAVGARTVLLAASGPKQRSQSYTDKQHGLFTYFMLKGMQGEADSDEDGKVLLSELYPYIQQNVRRQAHRMNKEQDPTLVPALDSIKESDRDMVLVQTK